MIITSGGTPAALAAALAAGGLTINSLVIKGNSGTPFGDDPTYPGPPFNSWGTYTNASAVYGLPGPGIILSTGKVWPYIDGPVVNPFDVGTDWGVTASAAQNAILTPVGGSGGVFHDPTQIDITFTLDPTKTTVNFKIVFGSMEYPEFLGPGFVDSFGILIGGAEIAVAGGTLITVTAGSWSGGKATAHPSSSLGNLNVGQLFQVSGVSPAGYNAYATLLGFSGGSVQYSLGSNPGPYVSGGVFNLPININHPAFSGSISGVPLNGVLAPGGVPVITFSQVLGAGASGSITFIIADMRDGLFDSVAWITGLSGTASPASQDVWVELYGWKLNPKGEDCAPKPVNLPKRVKRAV